MTYQLFHITQFLFQLIYMSAFQLQQFFLTDFNDLIAEFIGTDLGLFAPGVTVLEALFGTTLTLVFALIIYNFLKSLLPG